MGGHQRDVWTSYFFSVDRSEQFNKAIAYVAIMLASLGLYGLIALNFSRPDQRIQYPQNTGREYAELTWSDVQAVYFSSSGFMRYRRTGKLCFHQGLLEHAICLPYACRLFWYCRFYHHCVFDSCCSGSHTNPEVVKT